MGKTVINPSIKKGSWITLSGNCYYRIVNDICYLYGYSGGTTIIQTTLTNLCTLPSNARPTQAMWGALTNRGALTAGYVQVDNTSGVVSACANAATGYWAFAISFPIG